MKKLNAYEDETYVTNHSKIWLRNPITYTNKYCNLLVNVDATCQICIIGYDSLIHNLERIKVLYKNEIPYFNYDFILLDNKCTNEYLWSRLDYLKLDKMKCYTLIDHTHEELTNYFKLMYLSTEKYEIIDIDLQRPKYNTSFNDRHQVINNLTNKDQTYLEIGVESGYTFNNVHFSNKIGVDPDPKFNNTNIHISTSDEYFDKCLQKFDVIFIDGMHHSENVLRDFNNSLKFLNEKGSIFIDDILPLNYNEQLRIPLRHHYENGILKYGEEWTGDVWKTVYYLLVHHQDILSISYYYNINYRGIAHIKLKTKCINFLSEKNEGKILEKIKGFDYFKDFKQYLRLLTNNK
jgi:hypothetical protein